MPDPILRPFSALRMVLCVLVAVHVFVTPTRGACDEGDLSLSVGPHYHLLALWDMWGYHLGGVTIGLDWAFSKHGVLRVSISEEGGCSDILTGAMGSSVGLRISTLIEPNEWVPFLGLGLYGGVLYPGVNEYSTARRTLNLDGYLEMRGEFGLHYRPSSIWDIGVSAFLSATLSATGCTYCGTRKVGIGWGAGTALTTTFYILR